MRIKRLVALAAGAGVIAAAGGGVGSNATPAAHAAGSEGATINSPAIGKLPKHLTASYGEPRGDTAQTRAKASLAAAGSTIPMFSTSLTTGGHTYNIKMVGKNPRVALGANQATAVPNKIIPIKLTFTSFSNTVFDPTVANACAAGKIPMNLVSNSPIYQNHAYTMNGQNVGTTQYNDAERRAEFWKFTKSTGINPNYHVTLTKTVLPKISLTVSGGSVQNTTCGKIGLIDIGSWDNYLRSTLMPALAASGVTTTTLPTFVFSNVYMYDTTLANCCILGYHDAYSTANGLQTYSVAAYDTSGAFGSSVKDLAPYSHEIGEWMDDPDVSTGGNPTPAWGNIGQVSGCQGNFENGDPLSGTMISVTMPNGVTYHPQELAFISWFYHTNPSWGAGSKFSSNGTFTTFAAPCP